MITDVNQIIFKKSDFANNTIFYNKLMQQIQLLLETGNVITIATPIEEKTKDSSNDDVVIIKYNLKDIKLGLPYPCWLYPDEIQEISNYQQHVQLASCQQYIDVYNRTHKKSDSQKEETNSTNEADNTDNSELFNKTKNKA
jgi:hypothetical protein